MTLVVPRAWLLLDMTQELLVISAEGKVAAPRSPGTATEAAAESTRSEEQGHEWRRQPLGSAGFLYVPEPWAERLLSDAGLARLGLG